MNIAVLGAGVSGLTAARKLKENGHNVTVYEKAETPGGLARTRFTQGYLYDPYGGHIFNSKHKEVVDWMFSLLPKENWQYTVRNAKIYFKGKYVSYPFELSLCELEIDDAVDCVYDFVMSQQGKEPDNFKDWLKWNFGNSIAEAYMIPYNEKIWSYPLENMGVEWVQGKMPLPTKKELIKSMLLKNPSERKMPHSTFYYPLHGGIQTMVNAIADGLNIQTGVEVKSIKKQEGKWYINNEVGYDSVISTIPLPELPSIMTLPESVVTHIKDLKFNSLTTVLFSCPETDISWLYVPSHDYRSHRVGYQSTLTPNACPNKGEGCAAMEIIGDRFEITKDFASNKNILPEELGFKSVIDSEFTKYAYVIHDKNININLKAINEYFNIDKSFRLLGRWANWNYRNMDLCMLAAMELVKEIDKC